MNGFVRRIAAHTAAELPAAFRQIDDAQKQGCWVALLLDYELGEWLEPAFSAHGPTGLRKGLPGAQTTVTAEPAGARTRPRLTALVFEQAHTVPVWCAPNTASTTLLRARPLTNKSSYLERIASLRSSIGPDELYQTHSTYPLAGERPAERRGGQEDGGTQETT